MAKQKPIRRFDNKRDEALEMRNSWLKIRDTFLEEFSAQPESLRSSKLRKVYRNLEKAFGKFDKVTRKAAIKVNKKLEETPKPLPFS